METIGEDSSGSTASVKAFTDAILKDKDQRTDEMVARDDGLTEGLSHYFEELVKDFDQLERILIARKYETGASVDLFWEQVRFRARWEPDRIRPEHIATALASGAWRLCGYSRRGCVVSNYKLQHWDPSAYDVDEYAKFVVFMMELMISKMLSEQKFVLLFDLKGFQPFWVFRKDVRRMISKLIYIAQAQYPERLQKVFLLNSPAGFEAAWKLVRSMLDDKTAGKISFVARQRGGVPFRGDLEAWIDPSVLPIEYGGLHAEYHLPC